MHYFVCSICNESKGLNVTREQLERYHQGEHAQNVFPHLSADDRELIISSTCGSCFDNMFADDEEEKTNTYLELKQKHEREIEEFPMAFAFSNQQFKEAMHKLGLTENDTDKIYSIGAGGFIRKTDSKAFKELFDRIEKEKQEAIDADETGEGFIFEMFMYELANHEYGYTRELEPTLEALGLTTQQINENENLLNGLKKARIQF